MGQRQSQDLTTGEAHVGRLLVLEEEVQLLYLLYAGVTRVL